MVAKVLARATGLYGYKLVVAKSVATRLVIMENKLATVTTGASGHK